MLNIENVSSILYGVQLDFSNVTMNSYGGVLSQSSNLNLNYNTVINSQSPTYNIRYNTININDNAQLNLKSDATTFIGTSAPGLNINLNSAEAKLNISSNQIFGNGNNFLTFTAVAGSSYSWNGTIYHTDVAVNDNTMTYNKPPQGFTEVKGKKADDLPSFEQMKEQNAKRSMKTRYQSSAAKSDKQYKKLINQYDELINDASYKGINLLKGNDLSVIFNEDRSSSLTVDGADMTSSALGLTTFEWNTQSDIAQSLSEIAEALSSIRSFTTELGNNYSILTTRQNFTDSLINVLTEGADNLTLADMNSESATMLALQTRQQLAVNALSLASEATREILKLF